MTDFKLPKNFCAVPFASIIFNPDGIVGSCREKGSEHEAGNIKDQSWRDIWNSPFMQKWRQEFIDGKVEICKEEQMHRSCHRLEFNQALLPYIDIKVIQDKTPIRLSPDFNGQCNLTCPMCHIWQKPNGLYDEINFWGILEQEILPHLKQIDPLAGEPFIQKDLYRLIDLASSINPECVWKFTTNAYWNFTPYIKQKLDLIKIDSISISLDSIDQENYKIIRTGELNRALKTIDQLLEYNKERKNQNREFRIILNYTIQIQNARELPELIRFAKKLEAYPFIQGLYFPEKLSLQSLNEVERLNLIKFYLEEMNADELMISHRILRLLLDTLPSTVRVKLRTWLDALTSNNFGHLYDNFDKNQLN